MSGDLILVTGGTGFLGSHCILAALQQGYRVRTTVRSLDRADAVRQMLKVGGADETTIKGLEFCEADLMKDEGFEKACKDCKYVLHVASPFPPNVPKDPNELIRPAREGTLRVLKAAKAAGTVKRVVVTSSMAAISYGHDSRTEPFTEKDWSVLDNPSQPVAPYPASKTIAERAAWDWIAEEGGDLELAVVNPVGIFGPVLSIKPMGRTLPLSETFANPSTLLFAGKDFAFSVELVVRFLKGDIPGLPQIGLAVVDVRDCAVLHLKAMTNPKAAGERFLACSDEGFLWTKEIAIKVKNGMGEQGKKVPTRTVPNFVLRLMSYFDAQIAVIVPELGKAKPCTNKKAKDVLGWQPRGAEEALVATGKSLFEHGIVK